MLQFGLFTTHIPYLIAGLIYLAYFGMSAFHKQEISEDTSLSNKSIVLSKQKIKNSTELNLHFFDYADITKKEATIQQIPNQDYYIPCKIPHYIHGKSKWFFSRPPPSIA